MLCPPLQAQVWTSNMSKIGEPWEGRRPALRSVAFASCHPELVAKLPLACKIFRDVLRGRARCLLGNGCSHRHNASSFVLA